MPSRRELIDFAAAELITRGVERERRRRERNGDSRFLAMPRREPDFEDPFAETRGR